MSTAPQSAKSEFTRPSVAAAMASAIGLMLTVSSVVNIPFTTILVHLTRAFGWSRGETQGAFILYTCTIGVFLPFAGRLVDRFGVRIVVLPGVVLLVLTQIAMGFQNGSIVLFYALFMVFGLCGAVCGPPPYTKVIAGWFHQRRGLVLALAVAANGVIGSLLALWVRLVIDHSSWRVGYFAVAGYVAFLGILLALLLRESPAVAAMRAHRDEPQPAVSDAGLSGAIARRTVAFWLCVCILLFSTPLNGLRINMVALLTDRHLPMDLAVTVQSSEIIGGTICQLCAAYLLDRSRSAKLGMAFGCAVILGLALIEYGSSYSFYLVGALLVGAGTAGENCVIPYFASRYFGLRAFGEIYGLMWGLTAFFAGLGPYTFGVIYDHTGSYHWALIYCQITALLVIAGFFLLPGYRFAAKSAVAE